MDAARQYRQARADRGSSFIDRTMLGPAREIAMFQPTVDAVVRGDPEAILFVEFAEDDPKENFRRLLRLNEVIGDLGHDWSRHRGATGAVWSRCSIPSCSRQSPRCAPPASTS